MSSSEYRYTAFGQMLGTLWPLRNVSDMEYVVLIVLIVAFVALFRGHKTGVRGGIVKSLESLGLRRDPPRDGVVKEEVGIRAYVGVYSVFRRLRVRAYESGLDMRSLSEPLGIAWSIRSMNPREHALVAEHGHGVCIRRRRHDHDCRFPGRHESDD